MAIDLKTSSQRLAALGNAAPELVLDERRVRANIKAMAERARRSDSVFRPHFKTHQSHVIARWFAEAGVSALAVSSAAMARYFAAAGSFDSSVFLAVAAP